MPLPRHCYSRDPADIWEGEERQECKRTQGCAACARSERIHGVLLCTLTGKTVKPGMSCDAWKEKE